MEQLQIIKCDIPERMTLPEYRRLLARPRRHSRIRRFAGYGIVR